MNRFKKFIICLGMIPFAIFDILITAIFGMFVILCAPIVALFNPNKIEIKK
jgi:hypothetical protein